MPKSKIEDVKHLLKASVYEQLDRMPKESIRRRRTKYDQVLTDAKAKPRRLVFADEKKAINVYVALRARIRRDREALQVRKRGLELYVFVPRGMRGARLSTKIRHSMKPTKMRSGMRMNKSA
jgi:hypothetical protein